MQTGLDHGSEKGRQVDAYADLLNRDCAARQALADALARDHAKDFANADGARHEARPRSLP
jgi:hypothetical protein